MALTGNIEWETIRIIDASTLTGAKIPIGDPLEHPSYILKLVNDSTSSVLVGKDLDRDIDVAPAQSFFLYDEGKVGMSGGFAAVPAGTQIYITGSVGTGNIYLVSQFIVTN